MQLLPSLPGIKPFVQQTKSKKLGRLENIPRTVTQEENMWQ